MSQLGPITTGLGEVFQYTLVSKDQKVRRDRAAHGAGLHRAPAPAHRAGRHRRELVRRPGEAIPGHHQARAAHVVTTSRCSRSSRRWRRTTPTPAATSSSTIRAIRRARPRLGEGHARHREHHRAPTHEAHADLRARCGRGEDRRGAAARRGDRQRRRRSGRRHRADAQRRERARCGQRGEGKAARDSEGAAERRRTGRRSTTAPIS